MFMVLLWYGRSACTGQYLGVDAVFRFFFKQKTAYEMRISDWSSDVCSADLLAFVSTSLPNVAQNDFYSFHVIQIRKSLVLNYIRNLLFEIGRASCRERVCQ